MATDPLGAGASIVNQQIAAQAQAQAASANANAQVEAARIGAQGQLQSTAISSSASTYNTQLQIRAQQENLAAQIEAERFLRQAEMMAEDGRQRMAFQEARMNLTAQIWKTAQELESAERQLSGSIGAENARFAAEHGLNVEQFNLQKAMFEAQQFANPADWIKQAYYLRNAPAPTGGPLQTGRVDVPFTPANFQPGHVGAGPELPQTPEGTNAAQSFLSAMGGQNFGFTYGGLGGGGGGGARVVAGPSSTPGVPGNTNYVFPVGGTSGGEMSAAGQGWLRGGAYGIQARGYAYGDEIPQADVTDQQDDLAKRVPAPAATQPLPSTSVSSPPPPPGSTPLPDGGVLVGNQKYVLRGGVWVPDSSMNGPIVQGVQEKPYGGPTPNAAQILLAGGNPAGILNPQPTSFGGTVQDQYGATLPLPTPGASILLSPHGPQSETPENQDAFNAWLQSLLGYQADSSRRAAAATGGQPGLSEGGIPSLAGQGQPLSPLRGIQNTLSGARTPFGVVQPDGTVLADDGTLMDQTGNILRPGSGFATGQLGSMQKRPVGVQFPAMRKRVPGGAYGYEKPVTAPYGGPMMDDPYGGSSMQKPERPFVPQDRPPLPAWPFPNAHGPAPLPPQPTASMFGRWKPGLPGWLQMPGMAFGGQGEFSVVGERGPELLRLPPGAQVIPLQGGQGPTPFYNVTPANRSAANLIGGGGQMPMRMMGAAEGLDWTNTAAPAPSQSPSSAGMPMPTQAAPDAPQQAAPTSPQDLLSGMFPAPAPAPAPAPSAPITIMLPPSAYPQAAPAMPPTPQQVVTGYDAAGKPIYGPAPQPGQNPNIPAGSPAGWNGLGYTPAQLAAQPWLHALSSNGRLPAFQAYGGPLNVGQMPGGADTFGSEFPSVPAPHQFPPQLYNNMLPQEREMALAYYRALGLRNEDVISMMQRTLPGTTNASPATWRV